MVVVLCVCVCVCVCYRTSSCIATWCICPKQGEIYTVLCRLLKIVWALLKCFIWEIWHYFNFACHDDWRLSPACCISSCELGLGNWFFNVPHRGFCIIVLHYSHVLALINEDLWIFHTVIIIILLTITTNCTMISSKMKGTSCSVY